MLQITQVFGWLWTVQWFLSIQYTGVAGAISNWYFTKEDEETNEKKISSVMLSFSMWRTVRYHSGTMALGSFVIAVVICIKFVALYAVNQLQAQASENKAVQFALKALKYIILCVEKFIRFMGHLAYIEVAIWGKTFCGGLLTAVKLLAKNVVRFSFVTLFSKLVLILGKLLIVVSALGVSYVLLPYFKTGAISADGVNLDTPAIPGSGDDAIPILPLFLVGFFSLTISINVMGIYETAIDTIMVSFLEDEMENNGGIFGSGPLKSFMKGTKSVSVAAEQYAKAIMDAKNDKVRSKYEMESELKNSDLTPVGTQQPAYTNGTQLHELLYEALEYRACLTNFDMCVWRVTDAGRRARQAQEGASRKSQEEKSELEEEDSRYVEGGEEGSQEEAAQEHDGIGRQGSQLVTALATWGYSTNVSIVRPGGVRCSRGQNEHCTSNGSYICIHANSSTCPGHSDLLKPNDDSDEGRPRSATHSPSSSGASALTSSVGSACGA